MNELKSAEEALRDRIDAIEVKCARCEARAQKILRCRRFHFAFMLMCSSCVEKLAASVVDLVGTTGHTHCGLPICPDAGTTLFDVAEVVEL